MPGLKYFLDNKPGAHKRFFKTNAHARHFEAATKKLELQGVDFKDIPCMVDLHAALKFLKTTIDKM
eukprot:11225995-Lingulodinium_polyedra.AAC.1